MDNLVCHYTTLEALQGIVTDDICLWATRYDHLNDPSEQIWASNVLLTVLLNRKEFAGSEIQSLKAWLNVNSYIISMCKDKDYRNMWRLYCNDGHGVCLCFDSEILSKCSRDNLYENPSDWFDIYEEVEYSNQANIYSSIQTCMGKEVFNLVDEEEASRLMHITPFIKNDDFDIEHEIRYARIRQFEKITYSYNAELDAPDAPISFMNKRGEKLRMRGNELIPYFDIHFPAKALKKIIVGYETDFDNAKNFIRSVLCRFEDQYDDVEIVPSRLFSAKDRNRMI